LLNTYLAFRCFWSQNGVIKIWKGDFELSNHPELAEHMQHFGLKLLGHALEHACFFSPMNQYWQAFGVLHAAQAAEILIKSCIAKEHTLLIFSKIPVRKGPNDAFLSLDKLFDEGKTLTYSELPDILWASTGYAIEDLQLYKQFGELRNKIQHLGVPDIDLSESTLLFIIKVIEPLLQHFWQTSVLDNLEDDDNLPYICKALVEYQIPIPDHLKEYVKKEGAYFD
jgi:hypothetical protein